MRPKKVAFTAILCATLALSPAILAACSFQPSLSEKDAIDLWNPRELAKEMELESDYGETGNFSLVEAKVTDQASCKNNEEQTASALAIFENQDYEIQASYELLFSHKDGRWSLDNEYCSSTFTNPKSGITDEDIVSHVVDYISLADKNQKGASSKQVELNDLYSKNVSASVQDNKTSDESERVAIVKIEAKEGIAQYQGLLTVTFNCGENGWQALSAEADSSSFVPDYSALLGEHAGAFQRTEAINKAATHCFGGRSNPFSMNVKSVSADGSTFTADLSFTVHNHLDPDNAVESCSGDSVYVAKDTLVPLTFGGSKKVFQQADVNGAADITVYFSIEQGSNVLNVRVEDSYWPGGDWDTYADYYTVEIK